MSHSRRTFVKQAALFTGAMVLMPSITSCGRSSAVMANDPLFIPVVKPAHWDAVAFNKERALVGGAPASYHGAIGGTDGDKKHVGKHLPYLPKGVSVPDGYVAVMFGDADKGFARHPNSEAAEEIGDDGHWYDWIEVRKAVEGDADVVKSVYSSWPAPAASDNGKVLGFNGKAVTDNGGRETVYLAALPKGVAKGDMISVRGHCKKHGDWVDFFTL